MRKKIPIQWGKKVTIRNPEQAGLEEVILPGGEVNFFVMPSFNGNGLDEEASTVYWRVTREGNNTYREVFGEKRSQVIKEYKKRI